MKDFNAEKVKIRYNLCVALVCFIVLCVLSRALYIMTVKRSYWQEVANRMKKDSVIVKPTRGNILSSEGFLMASSLPEYKLFIDFQAIKTAKFDSLWHAKLDSVCKGLSVIFPTKSAAEFKKYLSEGYNKNSRHWPIWKERVNYNVFTDVQTLPFLKLSKNKSGFHYEEFNSRQRPYGSLAQRTVGDLFKGKDTARYGLELSYDSILRGVNGITHRRKVLNKFINKTEQPPINGLDIVTTIDVSMQDLAERSVVNQLKAINGNVGVAIVMEVSTGDVKAIVNMERCNDGEYREIRNHAVSDLLEPGSVFKVASMLVALNDGVADTTTRVNTGSGKRQMHGRDMKDHNWHNGGYGTLSLTQSLMWSSNIGVSVIIDDNYGKNPEKFVQGIHNLGLADNLHLPLAGSSSARIRMPKKDKNGQWKNWSKTALPWMSIGYETQVPPISTLAFYNAIANNGCMMKPRFVKAVMKNGEVVKEYPPVVLRKQIAKPKAVKEMQEILEKVVHWGLGKKAGSKAFKVAGKTGTAQMSRGIAGYKSGAVNYLLSFAGFFPADAPRYSCIVCIQKTGLPASGGGMCGPVFHEISEGIMAKNIKLAIQDAKDSASVLVPEVKFGNLFSSTYVLDKLGIKNTSMWSNPSTKAIPVWGIAKQQTSTSVIMIKTPVYRRYQTPNVVGMGARDAVYILESRGIKTKLMGRGKVITQSVPAGSKITKGALCTLVLE